MKLLFPLMVSFTYGYINVGIDSYKLVGGVSVLDIGASLTAIFGLILMLIVVFIGGIVPGTNGFLVALLKVLGLEIVGLSIIPLLNFIILDVFVSDFSGAVGEKVNFISLVSRLI